jgi:aldehyde:ferredoxin oxidoreductase
MGSKNLKAIVASGNLEVPVTDPIGLQKQIKEVAASVVKKTARYKNFGTAGGLVGNAVIGDTTAKNWTIGDWAEEAEQISGQKMAKEYTVGRYYCPTCIIGCGRKVKSKQGLSKDKVVAGPEYETLAGFGVQIMVKNLASIIENNDLCNRYGLDTISLSGSIAFLLEAAEKGHLPKKYFEGLDLSWGNDSLASSLIHKVVNQTELGQLISKGVRGMMLELGEITKPYAIHVKGLEPSFHDPRALSSLAVAYATYPRGACHRGCSHTVERNAIPELGYEEALDRFQQEGKGKMTAVMQDYAETYNCLKLCQFLLPSLAPSDVTGWLNSVVGWDMETKELLTIGERNINLKRLYNYQCGVRREDDTLPERFLKESFSEGGAKNFLPNLNLMLEEYYQARSWNSEGLPTLAKRIELGLAE